ncbi:hypothetical protein GCM10027161_21640 [Microbispora hainanensis]
MVTCHDLYYDRAKLREAEESGVLLVRPHTHIARRPTSLPGVPSGVPSGVLGASALKPRGRA